jgi:hypothetical protein
LRSVLQHAGTVTETVYAAAGGTRVTKMKLRARSYQETSWNKFRAGKMLVNFLKPRIARRGIPVPFDVSLPRRNPHGRACRKIINRGRAGNRQRRHSFLISKLYRELSEKVQKYQTVSKLRIARRQASRNFRFLSARSRLPPDSADSRLPRFMRESRA